MTPKAEASVGVATPTMINPTTANTTTPIGRMLIVTTFRSSTAVARSTS